MALESCLVFEKSNVFNEALSLNAVLVLGYCFTAALLLLYEDKSTET